MSTASAPIRVGIVGANHTRGWGSSAHLPALAHLPEFRVTAVATTKRKSAEEAGRAFDVPLAFAGADDLVVHPDVDLVVISVKVPSHAAVIRGALGAGKHVLSEWPLGVDLREATELAELASRAGVVHAVGLQGTHAPGAAFVRDFISEGGIGRVQSVSIVTSSGLGGNRVPETLTWALDPAAGVSVLSIIGGHVLATLAATVGQLRGVSAVVANLNEHVTVVETGARVPVGTPNQVGILGTLDNGAVVSVTLQGGTPPTAGGFTLQILGDDGALTITPVQPGGSLHIADWAIRLAPTDGVAEDLPVPERYRVIPPLVPSGPPANVAALYREIARAIAEGRQASPNLDTAVDYHRLLATIEEASQTGTHQVVS
jgi:predicted dehydrogenase